MPRRTRPKGPELLDAFLKARELSCEKAGEALGVSRTTVWHWVNRVKVPQRSRQLDIETWTSGTVPASSWGETKSVVPFQEQADESFAHASVVADKTG